MSLDKKIQDSFNPPPSLEGEDWLVPSDNVFDAVETAIYGEEEPQKKPIWIWVLSLLLLGAISAYMIFTSGSESNNSIDSINTEIKKDETNSDTNVKSSIQRAQYESNSKSTSDKSINAGMINGLTKMSSITSNNFIAEISKENVKDNVSINGLAFNNPQNFTDIKRTIKTQVNTNTDNLNNNIPSLVSAENIFNTSKEALRGDIYSDRLLLLSNDIKPMEYTTRAPSQNSGITPLINDNVLNNAWSVSFSSGVSQWVFDLNNNYQTALQPADFQFENSVGYFVQLGMERRMSNRVSFGATFSVDKSDFTSGHNSVVDYDINNELSDMTKDFGLTMASPLGFLESEIVVARSVDAPNNTSLTIDLHNSHTVTNFDLGLYGVVDILQYGRFSSSLNIGAGINYLSKVSNTLDRFSTSESGFDSNGSTITADQSNLNNFRPYYHAGINVEYRWSPTISIGATHQWRQDFTAAYQIDDFSTMVTRKLSGLYIKKGI